MKQDAIPRNHDKTYSGLQTAKSQGLRVQQKLANIKPL